MNTVFVMTDQHYHGALGCAGNELIETPAIDALAEDGVFFENTYCAAPVCGPSRACIATGEYVGTTGVPRNHVPLRGLPVLYEQLQDAGVFTGLVGKLHLDPMERDWGFEWRQFNDSMYNTYAPEADVSDYVRWLDETTDLSGDQWVALFEGDEEIYDEDRLRFYLGESHTDDEHHFNTWTGDQSVRFVEEAADDGRPFFLHAGFFGPHQPMLPPEPWASMYDPDDVELMPEFYADHDHRPIFENYCSHRAEAFREQGWTEETFRSVLAAYYGQISQIDHQVGRIVEALKQMGVYDDTLFIFTADHGDHNGQFGMLSKGTMYEASARVPLVIAGPGVRSGRRHEPVNNIGLYGTVLDYHGIEAGDAPAGTLRPLLGGRASEADTSVYSCLAGRSLLRRDDIKLIRQDPGKLGPDHVLYEMYDLSDGREMENIYDDPVFAEVRADLQKDLDAWHEQQMAGYRR